MWFVKLMSSISNNYPGFKGESVSNQNFYGIWGLGRSGKAAYQYLLNKNENIILIDQSPVDDWKEDYCSPKVQCFQQDDPELGEMIPEIKTLILSPGIPRTSTLGRN